MDRLFAIWQALNPTSYTINKRAGDGTFVIDQNSTETAKTSLAPFVDASGSRYWTSESARQTETFNYAYPETQRWTIKSDAEYQASVRNAVQQLYGGISNQFALMSAPAAPPTDTENDAKAENVSVTARGIMGNIKQKVLGDAQEDEDGTRGIDFESESEKCRHTDQSTRDTVNPKHSTNNPTPTIKR